MTELREPFRSLRRSLIAVLLVTSLLGIAACEGGTGGDSVPPPSSSSTTAVPTTATSTTTTSTTTTSTSTTTTSTTLVPGADLPLGRLGDPEFRVLFSIPVGEEGVTYRGGFEDWEVSGPQALTVAPDGAIWIADTGGRRLLEYSEDGSLLAIVDTDALEVGGLIDLAATEDGVWGLEVIPAIRRHRIVLFDGAGRLVGEHELPAGLYLEDGLSGIAATADGDLWIELADGAAVYAAFDATGAFAPHIVDGYEIEGLTAGPVAPMGDAVARFAIGGVTIEQPVRELGGLTFEGALPGWVALLLSDVDFASTGELNVEVELLYADLGGTLGATAAYPLDEVATSAYVPQEYVAVAPDGRLIAMKPGPDRVDVVQLTLLPVDHP